MKLTSVICSALLARAVTSCWAGAKGTVYKMTLHKVIDRQGTGKVAGTYLIPKGWSAEDNVTWVPNDYVTPVVATSKIKSPDGLIELQTLSGINIGFSHGPAGDSGQMPPRSVTDLLVQSFQRDYPGVQFEIVSKTDEPLNDPVLSNPSLGTARAERGTLKLRFTKNGRAMLLKSTARLDSFATHPEPTAIGGTLFEGSWLLSQVYGVIAPESKLSEAMKTAGIILSSTRIDIHFYNVIAQARQIIQQNFYAQQRQVMETSRIISQTNDEISAMITDSYNQAQATNDRVLTNFDDYIRGIDRYNDGGSTVQLPSGYAHAWSDRNGDYVITDDPLYNPNTGAAGSWHELHRKD